jgi:hypothetical protein
MNDIDRAIQRRRRRELRRGRQKERRKQRREARRAVRAWERENGALLERHTVDPEAASLARFGEPQERLTRSSLLIWE